MDECRAENCKWKHPHKRFCVHGHDTFEVGRVAARGLCRECRADYDANAEGKERHRRYGQSPRGTEKARARSKRWKASPKGQRWLRENQSRMNTLRSLHRIRERRGRITEQIRELSAQLLVGQEATNG